MIYISYTFKDFFIHELQGGLTAVMYTDTFQTVVMVIGSAVVMVTGMTHFCVP